MSLKLSALLLVLTFPVTATAEFVGPGATSSKTTIKAIDGVKDDTRVTLEGYIIKQIKSEHYTFKDNTGEIEVEIDDKNLRGMLVTPETKIRIVGDVDKEWTSTTIDVDYVEMVK